MPEREPMTQTMLISDVERDFGKLLKRVSNRETRVVVEDQGAPVAVDLADSQQHPCRLAYSRSRALGMASPRAVPGDTP